MNILTDGEKDDLERLVDRCGMQQILNALADIAGDAVRVARRLGMEPRVAFLAYSTFGQPRGERSDRVREAVSLLDQRRHSAGGMRCGLAP